MRSTDFPMSSSILVFAGISLFPLFLRHDGDDMEDEDDDDDVLCCDDKQPRWLM